MPIVTNATSPVTWTDAVSAIGAIATPLVVAGIAVFLAQRQSRSDELLKAQVEYYKQLVPDLNVLMCYLTFIGSWKEYSPPRVVDLKRRLDRTFYCAVPLFNPVVGDAYSKFERVCFSTFNEWGQEPLIRSSANRRRPAWHGDVPWDPAWDRMFAKADTEPIPRQELAGIREAYDRLLAALVQDLKITRSREKYTTDLVSLNAHAPAYKDVVAD